MGKDSQVKLNGVSNLEEAFSKAKIGPLVVKRVKKATDAAATLVQIPQGPTTETRNGQDFRVVFSESERVFPELTLEDVLVLDVLVAGGADGRAACEAALVPVWCAKGDD